MNKFDATIQSIEKILMENVMEPKDEQEFYIDMDLSLINEKYCSGGVDLEFIKKNALFFKVDVIELEKNSVRLVSSNKQKLMALLGTFIDSKKYDEVCSFIRGQYEEDAYKL